MLVAVTAAESPARHCSIPGMGEVSVCKVPCCQGLYMLRKGNLLFVFLQPNFKCDDISLWGLRGWGE